MAFQQFLPSDALKPYVKCYWIYTTDSDRLEIMFPNGCVELSINISVGKVATIFHDRSIKMPNVEVFGQLTSPARMMATKGSTLLVTRFHPFASALFFPNQVSEFTDSSTDLNDVFRDASGELYDRLMEEGSIEQKIVVLERFLVGRLIRNEKKHEKLKLVEQICRHAMHEGEAFNVESLASRYGFSPRYIQKLFLDFTGVSPKSFFTIQRFNRSLDLLRSSDAPLTSIAYACGYYDQAHFIREFKTFTGMTPSQFQQAPVAGAIE